MGILGVVYSSVDKVRGSALVQQARRQWFDLRFRTDRAAHLFKGVFDSFAAAEASAPPTAPRGYDNEASAALYLRRLQPDDHDYPSMFWIDRSLQQGLRSLVDIGGSVGIKFFAFQTFMDYPADLTWRVIDVPAVAERGRQFALEQDAGPALSFSDQLADAAGADIYFASGSLQYLQQSLPEMLAAMPAERRPRRIIVNTTPIHESRAFFTLNSIGTAYCAYRVEARQPFIDGVEACGYQLRDKWRNVGKTMRVAFEPALEVPHYSGFCFDRVEPREG
jgi:putative methyltransferase (TIGR04325 family)